MSFNGSSMRALNVTGSISPEFGKLTSLTTLYLDGNQLSGSIPSEMGSLTGLTKLCFILT